MLRLVEYTVMQEDYAVHSSLRKGGGGGSTAVIYLLQYFWPYIGVAYPG